MAKTTNLLSDIQIKRWIAKAEPVAKSDGDGLTLTLSKSGTATRVLRYRTGGRRKELAIGNYPDLGLAAAREKARAHRVVIDDGRDPAAEKQEKKDQGHVRMDDARIGSGRDKCLKEPPFAPVTTADRMPDAPGRRGPFRDAGHAVVRAAIAEC